MNMLQAPQGSPMMGPGNQAAPMMGQPMGQAMPPLPSSDQVQEALHHTDSMTKTLLSLTDKKPGTLTKKDVFGAAAQMIKDGLFSTPDAKQQLLQELAGLPNDEQGLRMAIGSHLLRMASAGTALKSHMQMRGMGAPDGRN